MKKAALHNLGCKVNSYETEVMQQKLQEKGYRIVPFDSKADIYIVNTCTVTGIADRKSRQMLHRAKQLNPDAVVVAAGCYVQTGQSDLEKDECVDLCIGNNRKGDIAEILEEYFRQQKQAAENTDLAAGENEEGGSGETRPCHRESDKTLGGRTIPDIGHEAGYEELQLRQTAEHTRVYIKVQDGCNQFCSYCAIPYARGRVRSRRAEDILTEVRALTETGYKEIVLTGIHISSYGIDFDNERYSGHSRLTELVEEIHEVPGIERIRLSSLEPRVVTADTARRLAALPKFCPHFHLSLQSGCDATLKRMNRHYTTGEYYTGVEYLRSAFEHPAITTDVIVGFPGETEEEFEQTKEFLEKVNFYEMHIFKYSRRRGTPAADMPGQVPEEIKRLRSNELSAMEKRQSEGFRRTYIDREAEVLLEDTAEIGGELWRIGHTKDYVRVAVKAAEAPPANTIVRVKVQGFLTEEVMMSQPKT
ncbi:MAG: tRNA (N(6)-L-threonylcarbamoyladenosine(37)-C(2))-methylthiotransferase MtaB [Butyrivibrio sp.]|nr:tRNA (N(6)-L-threonylcarbamoyladenosine(37)-C(2))-methylthiotransferase MtaB [Acetatifactor muris]MCM1560976.1 tRNA (N(6)-L-threonylcarbamoyladenosine(37)-C(2))-methylthiotransferase MtaB [Butyrivibrio sp.]